LRKEYPLIREDLSWPWRGNVSHPRRQTSVADVFRK
jgi:hypothetical protein